MHAAARWHLNVSTHTPRGEQNSRKYTDIKYKCIQIFKYLCATIKYKYIYLRLFFYAYDCVVRACMRTARIILWCALINLKLRFIVRVAWKSVRFFFLCVRVYFIIITYEICARELRVTRTYSFCCALFCFFARAQILRIV